MRRIFLLVVATLATVAVALAYSAPKPFSSSSSSSSSSSGNGSGQRGGGGGGGGGRQHHTPFIRKQDMYGIWRLTHQNMRFPTASITASRPSDLQTYPMKEFTVYPKNQNSNQYIADHQSLAALSNAKEEEIVIRLNDDGSFDQYITTDKGTSSTKRTGGGADQSSFSLDLQHVLGRGGAWEYDEQDGRILLAPGRPEDADGRKVHDTLLTGQLDVHVSECLPSEDQAVLPDDIEEKQNLEASLSSSSTTNDDQDLNVKNTDNTRSQASTDKPDSKPQSSSKSKTPDIDVHLSIPQGNVSIGKFMYPRKHKAFFDDPMLFCESSIGTFSMKQLLGNLNARLRQECDDEVLEAQQRIARKMYHKKDFYGRKFYLTATPHPINPQYAEQDKHFDEKAHKTRITVMPIEFFRNNTFTAHGAEKILRGRYGTTGENGDRLWFQVTLFGFGRKKGHVYSEGRLLSHDDRRAYLGKIQEYPVNHQEQSSIRPASEGDTTKGQNSNVKSQDPETDSTASANTQNQTKFFVEGDFYYGGWQAGRANSFGTFTLQEIDDEIEDDDDEEEDEEDRLQQDFIDRMENLMADNDGDDDNVFQ
jgi:hypothetical protein